MPRAPKQTFWCNRLFHFLSALVCNLWSVTNSINGVVGVELSNKASLSYILFIVVVWWWTELLVCLCWFSLWLSLPLLPWLLKPTRNLIPLVSSEYLSHYSHPKVLTLICGKMVVVGKVRACTISFYNSMLHLQTFCGYLKSFLAYRIIHFF